MTELKVGDKVWIKDGSDRSRSGWPSGPIEVDNSFLAQMKGSVFKWWCWPEEIMLTETKKKRSKGRPIGGVEFVQ